MGSIANPGARVRDRISDLPESLISHILSFLDTREAVRTSVLSTKWKKQWTQVPSVTLKFDDDSPTGIDHVLLFRGSSNIQKFSLTLIEVPYLDFSCLGAWIRTVIRRNVVELYFCIEYRGQSMELPQSLLTCKTLKVLKLDSYFFTFNPPTTGCFPSLKVLHVKLRVSKFQQSVFERIFSNCPVLEELTMRANFKYAGAQNINISAPELKMLKLSLHMNPQPVQDECHFYINAPKLVKFELWMDRLSGYLFQFNANADYKANIYLYHPNDSNVHFSGIPILDTISSVKHLFISSDFLFEVLPEFHNLTHLELEAPFYLNHWAHLITLLKSSPNLEDLVIRDNIKAVISSFYSPEIVPYCMLFHLKTITFKHFEGALNEMAVAKFLLKYSKVLKKMTVSTYLLASDEVKEIDKEFLMFERGSETCQIEILNK